MASVVLSLTDPKTLEPIRTKGQEVAWAHPGMRTWNVFLFFFLIRTVVWTAWKTEGNWRVSKKCAVWFSGRRSWILRPLASPIMSCETEESAQLFLVPWDWTRPRSHWRDWSLAPWTRCLAIRNQWALAHYQMLASRPTLEARSSPNLPGGKICGNTDDAIVTQCCHTTSKANKGRCSPMHQSYLELQVIDFPQHPSDRPVSPADEQPEWSQTPINLEPAKDHLFPLLSPTLLSLPHSFLYVCVAPFFATLSLLLCLNQPNLFPVCSIMPRGQQTGRTMHTFSLASLRRPWNFFLYLSKTQDRFYWRGTQAESSFVFCLVWEN